MSQCHVSCTDESGVSVTFQKIGGVITRSVFSLLLEMHLELQTPSPNNTPTVSLDGIRTLYLSANPGVGF